MGDADYRKPLTPAQLIERLERSNTTVIADPFERRTDHLARPAASAGLVTSSLRDGAVAMNRAKPAAFAQHVIGITSAR
jgi:hypothetical protein